MNAHNSQDVDPAGVDRRLLDRLVDGELSREEYQQALRTLSDQPGGWRQCALAFLESQAWRQSLEAFTGKSSESGGGMSSRWDAVATAVESPRPDRDAVVRKMASDRKEVRPRGPMLSWLGLAASVLLAFALGRTSEFGGGAPSTHRPAPSVVRHGGGGNRPLDAQLVQDGFWNGRPAVSPEVRDALGRLGTKVYQKNGYIPATTPDGQQVLLPVEEIQLVPVKNHPY